MIETELLSLFDAYDAGEFSFAEIFLASGLTVKNFVAFMKKHNIQPHLNFEFIEKGRGLNEDALKSALRMNNDEKK